MRTDSDGHQHGSPDHNRAFALGVALNLTFVAAEAVFGIRANSLALVADAGHNLSDVLGLALAWGASVLSARIPTPRRTYGLRRSSILAALLNAVILLVAIGAIAWEAIGRFRHPGPVASGTVIAVAAIGIVINGVTALLFMRGRQRDLNIRGAYLHMAADAGVSVGVVLAGGVIALTGWFWVDPVVSLIIVVLIAIGTWGLLRDSFNLALDAVPEGIDPAAIDGYLAQLPGVVAVHDLHIWAMSTTEAALTVHLVKENDRVDDALLQRICGELHDRFGIEHTTVQFESTGADYPCGQAPPEVV
jgi:cobalt-zinc-cadmium efflux system protein